MDKQYVVSDSVLKEAAKHLHSLSSKGDVEKWVVMICFLWPPNSLWNFMLDAVSAAKSDQDLEKIATGLAEHVLAHYGSMLPHFEQQAKRDGKFRRMLTGVWRHRMSDKVWMRLRAIQSDVVDPLPSMISLENGVEHLAETLSIEDRTTDDKGKYQRDPNGRWVKRSKYVRDT